MKGLEPEVVARLAEQAEAEGVSQQEWLRQILRRTAGRFSPAELAHRQSSAPMIDEEFAVLRSRVVERRARRAERVRATRGR